MRKWWWLLLIIPIILVWQAAALYQDTLSSEKDLQAKAIAKAKQAVDDLTVTDVEHYYGNQPYQVVYGTSNKESIYVWVPMNKKGKVITKKASEGWTKKRVKEHVMNEREPLNIIDIRLGMESGTPLWEVTYRDQQQRYTYYYLDFQSGELLKRYSLKTKGLKEEQ
ncbi:DUF5590 domain-containing protein [Bacillus tianshenii]|nr:DUF5590 domain-containing protein [Bacillus tianshenii]